MWKTRIKVNRKVTSFSNSLDVVGSTQSVSSLSSTDRFPLVPAHCFELDEGGTLATMWKTSIKYDRKETVFRNKPGGVAVKSKCFKFK